MLVIRHDGSQKSGHVATGETHNPAAAKRLRQLVQPTLVLVFGIGVHVWGQSHDGATAGAFPCVGIWHIGRAESLLLNSRRWIS